MEYHFENTVIPCNDGKFLIISYFKYEKQEYTITWDGDGGQGPLTLHIIIFLFNSLGIKPGDKFPMELLRYIIINLTKAWETYMDMINKDQSTGNQLTSEGNGSCEFGGDKNHGDTNHYSVKPKWRFEAP